MMKKICLYLICGTIPTLFAKPQNNCNQNEFRFSNLYQDRMVLQREPESATVWGYGKLPQDSDATVTCTTPAKMEKVFRAFPFQESDDIWKLQLEPQAGGTICTITIQIATGCQISINEVLFGDVYLCSGQSNMVFQMHEIFNASEEWEYSKQYTDIRYTRVVTESAEKSDDTMDINLTHEWSDPTQNQFQYMSAVCFLYARNIYDQVGIPLGLVVSAWGGTHIESWSTPEMLEQCGIDKEQPNCNGDMQNCNSRLYNKMIHPLRMNTFKGFLWYQGEANAKWNRDLYNCSFPAKIDGWRSIFSSNSNTNINAPYGFVQLSTIKYTEPSVDYPMVRWHQTADYGYVPNDRQSNVFMAVAIDTYDPENGVHPRYKQIVGQRLAIAGMNVVYCDKNYPTNGPMVTKADLIEGPILSLVYDQEISYNNEEKSGFYYCCWLDFNECNRGSNGHWVEIDKKLVKYNDSNGMSSTIDILIGEIIVCEIEIPHIAYLWRQTPIKKYLGAPIYAKDTFALPSAPWQMTSVIN